MVKEMNKTIAVGLISSLFALLLGTSSIHLVTVNAVKCEDIKHTDDEVMKWGGESHGDNNPSESKFNKLVEGKGTICEIAKCYDHDECKGEIEKHEYKEFKESIAYIGTTEEVNDCLDKRMDLGNELKDYEIHHCAVGSY